MRGRCLIVGLTSAILIPSLAAAQAPGGMPRPAPLGGYYGADGRWVGTGGYMDTNGRWHDASAAGHYDADGRWVASSASGYYDRSGRWIATAPSAGDSAADVAYSGRNQWGGAPLETRAREDWLQRRILRQQADGRLTAGEADAALADLNGIRRLDRRFRSYAGELSPAEEATVQGRLDDLRRRLDENR